MKRITIYLLLAGLLLYACSSRNIVEVPISEKENKEVELSSVRQAWESYQMALQNYDTDTLNKITTENFKKFIKKRGLDFNNLKDFFEQMGIARTTCDIIDIKTISNNKVKVKCKPVFYYKDGTVSEESADSFILIKINNEWLIDAIRP